MNYKENLLTKEVKEKLTLEEIEDIYNKVEEIIGEHEGKVRFDIVNKIIDYIL